MEDPIFKSSSAESQNESVSLNVDGEGLFDSNALFPLKDISSESKESSDIMIRDESNEEVNGYMDINSMTPTSHESLQLSDLSKQKTYSPTLIESAIKVMKNLFSPEKVKSKSINIVSPSNNSLSTSGSPCISISGKAELFALEPDKQNNTQFAPGENTLKNYPQNSESDTLQIPSPLDPLNNTDESFMTTVSLIDDSFHSAVTNLDENGEYVRNGGYLKENILNDSLNTDFIDPSNDTLENNDSCLDNTTLKIDSISSDGSKLTSCSVQNDDFGRTQSEGGDDDSQKVSSVQVQYSNCLSEKDSKSEENLKEISDSVLNNAVEMADLYLNKSFEKTSSEVSKAFTNGFEKETVENYNVSDNLNGIHTENEGSCVENSISTTTIVLNTGESVDLENMLMSLKADDSDTNISSIAFEGDDVICSMENEIFESNTHCKVAANNILSNQQKRSCFSEGNSPNRSEFTKTKLNKSDELLNRRMLSEPFEKNFSNDKSSVDFSLMKFSEASRMSKKSDDDKNVKQTESSKSEVDSPSDKTVISQQSYTILNVHNKNLNRPVIEPLSGDLSETFQKNDSSELIEKCTVSSNGSFGPEETVKSSQVKQSTPLWEGSCESGTKFFRPSTLQLHSPELPESDTKNTDNFSSIKPKQIFSNSESIDGCSPVNPNENSNSFGVEDRGSVSQQDHVMGEEIKQNLGVKPQSRKSKTSAEDGTEMVVQNLNETFDKTSLRSEEKLESCASHPLNQTFEKKSKTPNSNSKRRSQSQTPKQLNATFDIKSPNSNKTFTKSPEIGEANRTFNKSLSPEHVLLNKTYDKPNQLNQTFNKTTESPSLEKFNETFDKNPAFGKMIQVSDGLSESPVQSESNQTFVLDSSSLAKGIQEMNQTVVVNESDADDGRLELVSKSDSEGNEKKDEVFQKPDHYPPAVQYRTNNSTDSNDADDSFVSNKNSNSSLFCSDISTVLLNEDCPGNRSLDDLSEKLERMDLNENLKKDPELGFAPSISPPDGTLQQNLQTEDNLLNCLKDDKLKCDPDLVQLIREQFSSNDIEKICSVVQDFSSIKLTNDILKASEQFEKSFHGIPVEPEFKLPGVELNKEKPIDTLSPQSLDFLNSIGGKPTGRDLSRESLYVKFDPLVQPSANSLIDFTKEGEALAASDTSPVSSHSTSICEQLLTISPQKKPDAIVPPLTPLSHKVRTDSNEEKLERLKELQNEIYFLKNLYAERERSNKAKMEEYENQIAKLTGESCMLEDKLKESNEREKSLVKKMKEQNQSIGQLKIIMEEYVKTISKLSTELETIKRENLKQLEALSLEKDSYMTHLQNTEAAFTDVHTKYEKSKKTIVNLKANETLYKNAISEQTQKMEEFKSRAKEAQEKALVEFQKIQEELNQMKGSHSQEVARLKAQLRKTELKVEALQESLDQKIKENQQLTAICDELIEGKK